MRSVLYAYCTVCCLLFRYHMSYEAHSRIPVQVWSFFVFAGTRPVESWVVHGTSEHGTPIIPDSTNSVSCSALTTHSNAVHGSSPCPFLRSEQPLSPCIPNDRPSAHYENHNLHNKHDQYGSASGRHERLHPVVGRLPRWHYSRGSWRRFSPWTGHGHRPVFAQEEGHSRVRILPISQVPLPRNQIPRL